VSDHKSHADTEHLKEIIEIYKKVKALDNAEIGHEYSHLPGTSSNYTDDDIDVIIDTFSDLFSVRYDDRELLDRTLRSGTMNLTGLASLDSSISDSFYDAGIDPGVLYIVSRPFFRSMSRSLNADDTYWESGTCPVCGSSPSISILEDSGKRKYLCSFCGTLGGYKRIGCPVCHQDDPDSIDIIFAGDDERVRIDACKKCNSYVKTCIGSAGNKYDYEMSDIMSIALDVIAQEKGFSRKSPNAVGISVIN